MCSDTLTPVADCGPPVRLSNGGHPHIQFGLSHAPHWALERVPPIFSSYASRVPKQLLGYLGRAVGEEQLRHLFSLNFILLTLGL